MSQRLGDFQAEFQVEFCPRGKKGERNKNIEQKRTVEKCLKFNLIRMRGNKTVSA